MIKKKTVYERYQYQRNDKKKKILFTYHIVIQAPNEFTYGILVDCLAQHPLCDG